VLLQQLPDLAQRLRPDVPALHLVAEPHDEAPDAGVLGEHLDQGFLRYVTTVARHYREENLFLLAELDGGSPQHPRTNPDSGSAPC
jgi:hypothetical protein